MDVAVENDEPSVIDVFGDDSQVAPLEPEAFNHDKTIEADLGSFDEPSFVSVDVNTSISDFDSRSRYHTTELRRDMTTVEANDSMDLTTDYGVVHDLADVENNLRASQVSAAVSHTVGGYAHAPPEKKGFRYGFYAVLLLLIAVLGMQGFDKMNASHSSDEQSPNAKVKNKLNTPVDGSQSRIKPIQPSPPVAVVPDKDSGVKSTPIAKERVDTSKVPSTQPDSNALKDKAGQEKKDDVDASTAEAVKTKTTQEKSTKGASTRKRLEYVEPVCRNPVCL